MKSLILTLIMTLISTQASAAQSEYMDIACTELAAVAPNARLSETTFAALYMTCSQTTNKISETETVVSTGCFGFDPNAQAFMVQDPVATKVFNALLADGTSQDFTDPATMVVQPEDANPRTGYINGERFTCEIPAAAVTK